MKKFLTILTSLLVGGLACFMIVKYLDEVFELCLVVLVVEIVSLIILGVNGNMKTKGQVFIEEAQAAGRVVRARCVARKTIRGTYRTEDEPHIRNDHYVGEYEYMVGGRAYRCKRTSHMSLPEEVTMYYAAENPGKAIAKAQDMAGSYAAKAMLPLLLGVLVYAVLKIALDVDFEALLNEAMKY